MCSEREFIEAKKFFKVRCEVPKGLLGVRILVLGKLDHWVQPGELPEGDRITHGQAQCGDLEGPD